MSRVDSRWRSITTKKCGVDAYLKRGSGKPIDKISNSTLDMEIAQERSLTIEWIECSFMSIVKFTRFLFKKRYTFFCMSANLAQIICFSYTGVAYGLYCLSRVSRVKTTKAATNPRVQRGSLLDGRPWYALTMIVPRRERVVRPARTWNANKRTLISRCPLILSWSGHTALSLPRATWVFSASLLPLWCVPD